MGSSKGSRGIARPACILIAMCAAALAAAVPVGAVPANGRVWTFTQPDGRQFQAVLRGDEFHAYHETPAGEIVLQDPATGFWHYAQPQADGTLADTALIVGQSAVETKALNPEKVPWLRAVEAMVTQRMAEREADRSPARVPPAGTVKGIVLLANFSDTVTTFAASDFTALCNTPGYAANSASGSVRDYYLEASYGALTVQTDVYGWFALPRTKAYYGANDGLGNDVRPREMVQDAITASNATVNYANYDSDGDGWVDFFGVIHQGQGEEQAGAAADCIWSHRWSLASAVTVDGKRIQDYHTEPELFYTRLTTVGVLCHEMGHVFGLPDLYDTTYASEGVGMWSIMAGGSWAGPGGDGSKPVHFDPWCKEAMGWVTPTVVTATQAGLALPAFYASAGGVLRIPVDPYNDGEYFLVCNRYAHGTGAPATGFDQYCPGSGALVLHVDDYVADNDVAAHKKVSVVEADGLGQLDSGTNQGDAGDLYPNGAPTLSDATDPNANDYAGNATGIVLTNFTGAGTANMAVDVTPRAMSGVSIAYDGMGASGLSLGYGDGDDFGLVRFTAPANGSVTRVKTLFVYSGTTDYTVKVYSGLAAGVPTGQLASQTGSHVGAGAGTVVLASPVDVTAGQDFYVEVEYDTGGGYAWPIPMSFDGTPALRSYVRSSGSGAYSQLLPANDQPQDLNIRVDFQPQGGSVSAPTVNNAAATSVTRTTAVLHGNLAGTGGENPIVHFYWGDSDGGTTAGNWQHDANLGILPAGAFMTQLTGLTPGTTYYFRTYAANSGGHAWAPATGSFDTGSAVGVPVVTNTGVTGLSGTAATLNGTLTDTGGENPVVHLYWGTSDGGTAAGAWDNDENLGARPVGGFAVALGGLTSGQTYYFRVYAVNSGGAAWAPATSSFVPQTVAVPSVANAPATAVAADVATLNGNVTATGGETPSATIFFGTTDGGTNDMAWGDFAAVGLVDGGAFSADIEGLIPNTLYYFRAQAVNSAGTAWADASTTFTTVAAPLAVPTGVTASKGDDTISIHIVWNAVDGANSYKVFWAASPDATPQELTDWISDTEYDDDDVAVGTVYYYWVQAAAGYNGEQPSGLSAPDFGWVAMEGDPVDVKITYKNCDLTVLNNSLVRATNAVQASIKVQKLKLGTFAGPDVPGKVAYVRGGAGIPRVEVTGSVAKFSAAAPVAAFAATGTVSAFSTSKCYIATVTAGALGSVKMTAYAMSDSMGEQFETAIYTGNQNTTGSLSSSAPACRIGLTGVCLTEMRAPQQTVSVALASKKWKTPDGPDLSLASVPYYDTNVVEAGHLASITAKGGEISPARILSEAPVAGTTAISAQGMLFVGAWGGYVYEAPVNADQILTAASQLSVSSLAGGLSCTEILAGGEIALLASQAKAYRIDGELEYHGGSMGLTTGLGTMRVVSGVNPSISNANIDRVYATEMVAGDFYAGGDGTHGMIFRGYIGQIATSNPGPEFPVAPVIQGSGWSTQPIMFLGGDYSGFTVHRP